MAHLGDEGQVDLGDDVFDASSLYVVIWIIQGSITDPKYHRLPAQKLHTVPHAVTAKRATQFSV